MLIFPVKPPPPGPGCPYMQETIKNREKVLQYFFNIITPMSYDRSIYFYSMES